MRTLPGTEVTDPQFDIIVDTFGTKPQFEKWQKRAIIRETKRVNNQRLIGRDNDARLQEERDFADSLPPEEEDGGTPGP